MKKAFGRVVLNYSHWKANITSSRWRSKESYTNNLPALLLLHAWEFRDDIDGWYNLAGYLWASARRFFVLGLRWRPGTESQLRVYKLEKLLMMVRMPPKYLNVPRRKSQRSIGGESTAASEVVSIRSEMAMNGIQLINALTVVFRKVDCNLLCTMQWWSWVFKSHCCLWIGSINFSVARTRSSCKRRKQMDSKWPFDILSQLC